MAQTYEEMDAIAMLKADHRKVEALFEKFEQTNGKATKQKLAEQICLELKVHTAIEEEIFYPACRGKIEDDLVNEAYVEHDSAKQLINEIEAGGPEEDFYDAKVKVLSEMIEHHVEEEEKRSEGMFSQARAAGQRFAFLDQAHYSMVKTNTFNGVPLPSIWLWDSESDELKLIREFGYEDFKTRLG